MLELKPCPFCGGEAETKASRYEPIELTLWSVQCKTRRYDGKQMESCVASNSIVMYATEAEAVEAWNTRSERTCRNKHPLQHGFWCSECDAATFGDIDANGTLISTRYCPNCGSKVVE